MSFTVDLGKVKTISDGFLTGCISTILFNPIDRALYLMVRDRKSFLDSSLWKNPYQGVSKALYGRVISYGVYLSLFDLYSDYFKNKVQKPVLLASLSTGVSSVALNHGFNVVKMYQWSHTGSHGMFKSTKLMTSQYGLRVFFKGFSHTCARDCLFSATYFILSDKWNKGKNFEINLAIASFSSILSSPLNYFRSRHFFDFQERDVNLKKMVLELSEGVKLKETLPKKISYIVQNRFNIGLGTLRVGFGMAVSDKIYRYLKETPYLR